MATIRFTEQDRDDRGFVKAPAEPRSLADLMPTPQSIQEDAQRKPASKVEQALLAIVTSATIAIFVWRVGFGASVAPARMVDPSAAMQSNGNAITQPSPIAVAMLPAYAAPDVPLGQIESTRAITPVAHFGEDWIQAIVSGSGRIWLRASDWPDLAIVGLDLAPRAAPAPIPAAAPAAFVPEATAPPRCETLADIR